MTETHIFPRCGMSFNIVDKPQKTTTESFCAAGCGILFWHGMKRAPKPRRSQPHVGIRPEVYRDMVDIGP